MKPVLAPGTRPATRVFEVLAGAYKSKNPRTFLTHAAEVDPHGQPVRVLCSRVDVGHLCPDFDTGEAPTCPVCARKVVR